MSSQNLPSTPPHSLSSSSPSSSSSSLIPLPARLYKQNQTFQQFKSDLHAYLNPPSSSAPQSPSSANPLPPPQLARLTTMTFIASSWGFLLGSFLGGRTSSLQFLAENAHKLPVTVQGWYFYHKRKNYSVIWGGLKNGVVYAGRLGGLVALFGATEIAVDMLRETEDMWSTTAAGIVTASTVSLIARLPPASRRYAILMGTSGGLLLGALQQGVASYLGRPVKYYRREELMQSRPADRSVSLNDNQSDRIDL